jgi:hypothetical protein
LAYRNFQFNHTVFVSLAIADINSTVARELVRKLEDAGLAEITDIDDEKRRQLMSVDLDGGILLLP